MRVGTNVKMVYLEGLLYLFDGISTFVGYLIPKPSFLMNSGTISPIAGG